MSKSLQNTTSRDTFRNTPHWQKAMKQYIPEESYTLHLEMETQQIRDIQTLPEKPRREDGVDEGLQREEKDQFKITQPEFEVTSPIAKLR